MNTKVFFLEVTTGWFSEPGEIHNICRAWTLFALLAIWGEPRANIWWKCGQNKKENQVQPPCSNIGRATWTKSTATIELCKKYNGAKCMLSWTFQGQHFNKGNIRLSFFQTEVKWFILLPDYDLFTYLNFLTHLKHFESLNSPTQQLKIIFCSEQIGFTQWKKSPQKLKRIMSETEKKLADIGQFRLRAQLTRQGTHNDQQGLSSSISQILPTAFLRVG